MSGLIRVVGGVALRGQHVFLAKRKPGGPHGGLWEFPGGKVEPGESDAAALRRELAEELGAEVKVGSLVAVGRDERIELWCYRVELPELIRPTEAQEHGWFTRDELLALPTPPADRPAIEALTTSLNGL